MCDAPPYSACSDTVPHPDYGWLAMVQMDAMLTKWLGATDHAVEASVFGE